MQMQRRAAMTSRQQTVDNIADTVLARTLHRLPLQLSQKYIRRVSRSGIGQIFRPAAGPLQAAARAHARTHPRHRWLLLRPGLVSAGTVRKRRL